MLPQIEVWFWGAGREPGRQDWGGGRRSSSSRGGEWQQPSPPHPYTLLQFLPAKLQVKTEVAPLWGSQLSQGEGDECSLFPKRLQWLPQLPQEEVLPIFAPLSQSPMGAWLLRIWLSQKVSYFKMLISLTLKVCFLHFCTLLLS